MPYYNPYQYYSPYQRMQEMRQSGLLGRIVDSIEVVKAIDIPLDGSISYFPLANGSAIVTRQVQQDGTSKIIVYKPSEDEKQEIKYVTENELKDIREEIENIKKQLDVKEA